MSITEAICTHQLLTTGYLGITIPEQHEVKQVTEKSYQFRGAGPRPETDPVAPIKCNYLDIPEYNPKAAFPLIAEIAAQVASVVRARIAHDPAFVFDQDGAASIGQQASRELGRNIEHAIRVACSAEMKAARTVAASAVAASFPAQGGDK